MNSIKKPENADKIARTTHELIKSISQSTCAFGKHPTKKLVQDFMNMQELFLVDSFPLPKVSLTRLRFFQNCFEQIIAKQGLLNDMAITQNKAEQEILLKILRLFSSNIISSTPNEYMSEAEVKLLFIEYSKQYHTIRKELKKHFTKPTRNEAKQFIDANFNVVYTED